MMAMPNRQPLLRYFAAVKLRNASAARWQPGSRNPSTDSLKSDADVNSPVYPIRGSYDGYTCGLLDPPRTVYGRNCMVQGQPQATGSCYRTSFGDWSCGMIDANNQIGRAHF